VGGDLVIVLLLLVAAVVMFAINKPRMDAVALIMMVLLPFTGVISIGEALTGFSDPNIVLIAALFVIGDGLVRTGVAQRLGDWLISRAGSSEMKLLVLLMLVVGALGSVMSSTGVVAIFIPIVLRIAQHTGTPASQLMMPLSVAALSSGMITLVATAPNLVVNAELVRTGAAGFQFFSFTPFGVSILAISIVYMMFARRWLAANGGGAKVAAAPSIRDWIERYGLADREHRMLITPDSTLAGMTIGEIDPRMTHGANLLAIERKTRLSSTLIRPLATTELHAGDVLFIDVFAAGLDRDAIRAQLGLEELPVSGSYFADLLQDVGMVECVLPATSQLAGQTVRDARFRGLTGLTVVGIRRGRAPVAGNPLDEILHGGDTLLLVGAWSDIRRLQQFGEDLVVLALPAELHQVLPAASRAPQAVACLVLVIGLMVSGVVANVHAALIGCLLMGATGCIDLNSAYRSIHWQSLVLIVGMLPFSTALQRTGGVDLAADGLLAMIGGAGIYAVMASLFAVTAVLGLFISNTATAVLMAPVALAIANDMHASPYPFAMIVALAASSAFMTPVSSPVNTLVVTPGNYGFADFVRVGVPLTLIVLAFSVFLVPALLPP
jgi:di/tricarboxylate transporter